jgi:hypothetical protein
MKKYSCLFSALLCLLAATAQEKDSSIRHQPYSRKLTSEWVALVGFNSGYSFLADVGFGKNTYGTDGHHPIAKGYTVSAEVQFRHYDRLFGPKISVHAMGGAAAGAVGFNLIHYTNFKKTSLVFRPEYGIGVERFKVTYGYNWRLSKRDNFVSLNSHLVSLAFLIHVAKHEQEADEQ